MKRISKRQHTSHHNRVGQKKTRFNKDDEKESKENQMKSDEISDETIMKVLNAIGYEEKSWIQFVREQWNRNNK